MHFFSFVKKSQKRSQQIPSNLDPDSLNCHFIEIGQILEDKLPRQISQELPSSKFESMFIFPTDEKEVFNIIKALNTSKSEGYDMINTNCSK